MRTARRRSRKLGWRFVVSALLAVVLLACLFRAFFIEFYHIPSASMEPGLRVGDRVAVSRTDYHFGPIHRGDVVVFDGRGSFDPLHSGRGALLDSVAAVGQFLGVAGSETVYVKRVIGLPGDAVKCCDADGKIDVNGRPINETYLHPGDAPSDVPFDVRVPPGRLWLMGDHRSVSEDSRSLLGAPGGGMVPESKVIGRPMAIVWPPGRIADIPRVRIG